MNESINFDVGLRIYDVNYLEFEAFNDSVFVCFYSLKKIFS